MTEYQILLCCLVKNVEIKAYLNSNNGYAIPSMK